MKILFLGDGEWAQIALKKLIGLQDMDICGVVLRYENSDNILRKIAEEAGIKVYLEKNINNKEFINFVRKENIDIGVSMSFNQIIKKELTLAVNKGFVNCHAGKLPNYRGRNILNWALINDEKEIGITAHYIDEGIDTGDIISQAVIPVEESDNYKTLLDKAINKCPEILIDAIYKIKEKRVETIKQNHINGCYFSYRRDGDELIDWNWSARNIHNFIRAMVEPSPGAHTYLENKKIYVWESEEINFPNYISTPGEIIRKDNDGVVVKTGDSAIKIKSISYSLEGEKIIPKILVGKRLGINLYKKILELEEKVNYLEKKLANYDNM